MTSKLNWLAIASILLIALTFLLVPFGEVMLPLLTFPACYGLAIASFYAKDREKISAVIAAAVMVLATALVIYAYIEFLRALADYNPLP